MRVTKMKVIEPFDFAERIKDVYFDCSQITIDEIITLFNAYCTETEDEEYVRIANNIFRRVDK